MSGGPFLTVGEFAERIFMLLTLFPGSEVSGMRSKRRNAEVGGDPESWHRVKLASDVILDDAQDTLAFMARAKRLELEVFNEGDHLHVEVGI